MPTNAETVLPAITAQGCAIGLDGKTKMSKALAPSEAINHSLIPAHSPKNLPITTVKPKPTKAPTTDRKRSGQATNAWS